MSVITFRYNAYDLDFRLTPAQLDEMITRNRDLMLLVTGHDWVAQPMADQVLVHYSFTSDENERVFREKIPDALRKYVT